MYVCIDTRWRDISKLSKEKTKMWMRCYSPVKSSTFLFFFLFYISWNPRRGFDVYFPIHLTTPFFVHFFCISAIEHNLKKEFSLESHLEKYIFFAYKSEGEKNNTKRGWKWNPGFNTLSHKIFFVCGFKICVSSSCMYKYKKKFLAFSFLLRLFC